MEEYGKKFKHIIFTDVGSSSYGVKIIASTLNAYGFQSSYGPKGTGFSLYSDEQLLKSSSNNFAVLLSKTFYERPLNLKFRKTIISKFNSRPNNIYGELIRFIILDQGFKEGIDLFDVKYVHLIEPLTVPADEKQAIGRGTRFCGQKGLIFHPKYGWPLYVFKYDVNIPEILGEEQYSGSKTLFDMYIKFSNIDMRKIIFANELEKATIGASIDSYLTKNIHTFEIEKPPKILKGGALKYDKSKVPEKIMNLEKMKIFISSKYRRGMSYPKAVLKNGCEIDMNIKNINSNKSPKLNGNLVTFTPTQDLIRHYFQPSSAYKGILLHHSVGTGKTCTAIATASTSFDKEGYTILWVTRHTLKGDIWKNMFGQVCNVDIKDQIDKGLRLPNKISNKGKYISKNWLEPISYKQFSNMLLKKNKIYDEMVRRNGKEDPLRKTLLIIDEAHKLYSPTVASNEKPNTDILEEMIQSSYEKSGKNSVRVLLMTATPFTEDGMEMIKLLNILRDGNQLPIEFDDFSKKYLNEGGYFTRNGLKRFQDSISGYISYLNRSQDARNFAHPIIQNVYANFTREDRNNRIDDKISKETKEHIKQVKEQIKNYKKLSKEILNNHKVNIKKCKDNVKDEYIKKLNIANELNLIEEIKCKDLSTKDKKECLSNIKKNFKITQGELKNYKVVSIKECDNLGVTDDKSTETKDKLYELQRELNDYKELTNKTREVNKKKKEYREMAKVLNTKKKGLKEKIDNVRKLLKSKQNELRTKLEGFKSIENKKERVKKIRNFRNTHPLPKEVKDLEKKAKDLRVESSKFGTDANMVKYKHGLKNLKNASQEYALAKYCLDIQKIDLRN